MTNAQAGPRFRAPRIGEHNEEIYCGRLGYARSQLQAWQTSGVV
jgi:hypothetical protein